MNVPRYDGFESKRLIGFTSLAVGNFNSLRYIHPIRIPSILLFNSKIQNNYEQTILQFNFIYFPNRIYVVNLKSKPQMMFLE